MKIGKIQFQLNKENEKNENWRGTIV